MRNHLALGVTFLCAGMAGFPSLQGYDSPQAAQALGKARVAVQQQPDGLYICEAEEFRTATPTGAWKARKFGENYYAATFANSFLSRRAFLGAPEQCDETTAMIRVDVKQAGKYLVLVRYEAAYMFETQFRVRVEQGGRVVFNRLYGARDNLKIWAFNQKLKKEVSWSWGAVENIVWEGHDAFVSLQPGRVKITLTASKQPEPAARRNIDLVMLTTDVEQVKNRIEKEKYLPLDGMLTQSGDVFVRVTNLGTETLNFMGGKATGGGNWQQHSPYWVHMRNWPTPSITVEPGKRSEWVEVGGTMDSLNHGQWFWTGNGKYKAEFGLRGAEGDIEQIAEFEDEGDLKLAGDCDTRYSKRIRRLESVLYDLLSDLKSANPAAHGHAPQQTLIYGYTFTPLDSGRHAAAVEEFRTLFSLSDTNRVTDAGRGMVDVRSIATSKLEEYCRNLGANAKNVVVVSLGDEIRLPAPGAAVADAFHKWLQSRGLKPADLDPAAGDWSQVSYSVNPELKKTKPGVFYWSKRFQYHHGIQAIKQRTDILRQHLPNAAVGANFSPHYPKEHMFLGEVFKWVTVFRESGMTLPWSEDYIWQVPVGTPQMNNINLDLFRAGLRHHPDRKIMYYVMPHMPNNTPNQWRRLFYGALGHGMKMVDLFEFRPVHVAYTENHVDEPEMYRMVLGSLRELGVFEDIIQAGQLRPAQAGLWFSETGDIWGDNHGSFPAAKRALYTAIRHQQIPLDFLVEQDATDGTLATYKTLYLTDAHVSLAASKKIADWVQAGGTLFATAGAGMFDELNRPNTILRELMGAQQTSLDEPEDRQITWLKQHLPFATPMDVVNVPGGQLLPVIGVRSHIRVKGGESLSQFQDGSTAIVARQSGKGRTLYCGFLPSLSYYYPAIPRRPVDRGASDDSMIHFLPTQFDAGAARLIADVAGNIQRPVVCSEPLVESTIIESAQGIVIPLVNWSGHPVPNATVVVEADLVGKKVTLASGAPVKVERQGNRVTLTFDIDIADALIFRK